MPTASNNKVETLIVDSGPFIKAVPLQDWSNNVVTIKDVLSEIRDGATRQRLQVLPYQLTFREPSQAAIKIVTDFSKKTGDYLSLSAVDIRLIALTYQLECELGPLKGAQLRIEPPSSNKGTLTDDSLIHSTSLSTAGFYRGGDSRSRTSSCSHQSSEDLGDKISLINLEEEEEERGEEREEEIKQDYSSNEEQEREEKKEEVDKCEVKEREEGEKEQQEIGKDKENQKERGEKEEREEKEEKERGEEEERGEEDYDDDDEDWITPDNLQEVCDKMGGAMEYVPTGISVGCMTTDYAMQNVLLQMGLNVVSVEGMLIKRLQTYALQCKACFKPSFKRDAHCCPSCGNRTLIKVLVTANEDGSTKYSPLSGKQFSHKGLKYSVPLPKGGRQSNIAQLVPGQKVTFKLPRSRSRPHPLDPDYIGQDSPFAFNDVTSRGAQIGFRSRGERGHMDGAWNKNPNRVGKRKK